MGKYKIKDLKERLAKETSQEHKNKMLYMWVKQDHISLQEYNSLVINHSDLSHVMICPKCMGDQTAKTPTGHTCCYFDCNHKW